MGRRSKGDQAKRCRAIVREAKEGKDLDRLVKRARILKDPYYRSLALFDLSSNNGFSLKEARTLAMDALDIARHVERSWRQAELMSILAKKLGQWRSDDVQAREELLDAIAEDITRMDTGQGMSDAILGCAPRLGCTRLKTLLGSAISNTGFELKDMKSIIKQWASKCDDHDLSIEDIHRAIGSVVDLVTRSKLLGYLQMQIRRYEVEPGSLLSLEMAVDVLKKAPPEDRLEGLRYLGARSSTKEELEVVSKGIDEFDGPILRARLLATLGGAADKAGLKELASKWFKQGLDLSSGIEEAHLRASIRLNLAKGLGRMGEAELSLQSFQDSMKDCAGDEKMMGRICKGMEEQGFEPPIFQRTTAPEKASGNADRVASKGPHHVLALYDSYEGGLGPAHLRAVARAAPLCEAFDLDLALMGFPAKDLDRLISQVLTETKIGRGGKYLRSLRDRGRIEIVPCTKKEPPKDLYSLGLPVAATSSPKHGKKVEIKQVLQKARAKHPKKVICLIMGLGRRGLPISLLNAVDYHLELTGRNIPLETSTAMGVIAQQLKLVDP